MRSVLPAIAHQGRSAPRRCDPRVLLWTAPRHHTTTQLTKYFFSRAGGDGFGTRESCDTSWRSRGEDVTATRTRPQHLRRWSVRTGRPCSKTCPAQAAEAAKVGEDVTAARARIRQRLHGTPTGCAPRGREVVMLSLAQYGVVPGRRRWTSPQHLRRGSACTGRSGSRMPRSS